MADRSNKLIALLLWALIGPAIPLLAPGEGWAQELGTQKTPAVPGTRLSVEAGQREITAEQLALLRKQAETATDLTDEQKKTVLAGYDAAASELTRAGQLAAITADSTRVIQTAEKDAAELQAEIDSLDTKADENFGASFSLQELQTQLLTLNQQVETEKKLLLDHEAEAQQRDGRRKTLTAAQASLPERIDAARKAMQIEPPAGENSVVSTARRTLAVARFRALEAEGPAIVAELSRFAADDAHQLTSRRIELQRRKIKLLENKVQLLTARQHKARAEEASRVEREALDLKIGSDPDIQEWLRANNELAGQVNEDEQPNGLIAEASSTAKKSAEALQTLRASRKGLELKAKQLGMVVTVGMEFREKLEALPDPGPIRAAIATREATLATRIGLPLKYKERLEELAEQRAASASSGLLRAKFDILSQLYDNETAYISHLKAADENDRKRVTETTSFESYLRSRILWIRSNNVLGPEDLAKSGDAIKWLTLRTRWEGLPGAIADDFEENTAAYIAMIVLFLAMARVRRRCRQELRVVGIDARRVSCSRFQPTLRAIWLTILISIMWPGAIGFVGYRMQVQPLNSSFIQALGNGLQIVALVLLLLNLLRHTCRDEGLGEAHFAWDDEAVRRARSQLRSLMIIALPMLFVVAVLHSERGIPGGDSLERICYIAAMLTVAACAFRMMNPKQGVFAQALASNTQGWVNRTRWVWFPLSFGLPLALVVLAVSGHYFTAHELSWRLAGTVWMFVGLVITQALLVRWYAMNRRRARLAQARQRQQAMINEDAGAEAIVVEEAQNLEQVSRQTERMINTGLTLLGLVGAWFLWSQVLPAVGLLDEWTLWKTKQEITTEQLVDGTPQFVTNTVLRRITPLSILGAVFLVVVTVTATRNLPGAIEVMLLRHLPLEPALRYALRTVCRYLIVIVGLTMTFSAVGIGWGKVQWLVGGLMVGLGFGLQEIFANFVSGLIILFEQPVRIGDIVTIDDVSGTVSRIQIRATTITDWDYREYIVPNKELVTGRLMNWTLSDKTNRILIDVGVAYGSDTNLARSLLLEVAASHPLIMDEPAPLATFEGFGDSTLNLVLRCYLPNFDNRLGTISELHDGIDRAFAGAGIEIAFPQLEVNVRGELGPGED